jgi:ribosomal protein S27AE
MLDPDPKDAVPSPVENLHYTCPNCESPMLDRGCKLLCQRCGYFMGCSDFV